MSDDSLLDRVRSRVASLAPTQDGTADPQARDEDPTTVGREEFREEVDAEQVEQFVEEYYRNPLVRVPIQNFAADVAEPGLSVTVETQGDDDAPTVPESAPDRYAGESLDTALERWLSQAYIDGFSFDVNAEKLIEEIVKDRRGRRGTAVVEHAWDDPRERERLLALRTVKTETLTAYTREGKGIVLRPDDDPGSFDTIAINDLGDYQRDKAPTTPANQTAAVAQFDEVFGSEDREEIPFALDDLSISPHDADTGALFGRPDSATVINRARALRRKLRHVDQSVINTAFGNVIATVETNSEEIVRNVKNNLDVNVPDRGEAGDADPDSVSVTNAPVSDLHEVEGGVPDVTDIVQQEIEFILSALPTPLYRVGFAGDINRDVTSEQGEDYRDAVKRERRRIESDLQQPLVQKVREWMYGDATGDQSLAVTPHLRIRPSQAESPLRDEEFDAAEFSELMSGLSTAAGPKGGATAIIPKEEIIETMLDMDPEAVLPGQGEGDDLALPDETSEEVREAFEDFTAAELAAGDGPFRNIPVLPDNLDTLTEGWLNRWAQWIAAGRPDIPEESRLTPRPLDAELDFNPALHPRDPDTGQFVERSFQVPDDAPDFGDMSAAETLQYLDDNGANVSNVLASDSGVTIDGIPDDVTSVSDIGGGDGGDESNDDTITDIDNGDGGGRVVPVSDITSFQEDLEPGDQIQYDDGSETSPIEEIVEDDGTVAAIFDDGFVTETTVVTDPDDGPDLTPEGETIQDELGVNTVDLSGLDEGARQDLVSALRAEFENDEDLRDVFSTLGSVQTTPPSDIRADEAREAAAAFQGSTRTLYINPDSFNRNQSNGELNLGGIGLGPTDRQRTIQHELGHARHFLNGAENYGDLRERGLTDAERQLASEEVSSYAAYNPHEFVAEVHTGLRSGVEFGDDVLELYEELNGPEVDTNDN